MVGTWAHDPEERLSVLSERVWPCRVLPAAEAHLSTAVQHASVTFSRRSVSLQFSWVLWAGCEFSPASFLASLVWMVALSSKSHCLLLLLKGHPPAAPQSLRPGLKGRFYLAASGFPKQVSFSFSLHPCPLVPFLYSF